MEMNITNTIHNLTTYSFISLDQTESTFNDQITANIEYTDIKTNLNKNFVNNSSSIFKELTSTLPKFENQFLNDTKNQSTFEGNNQITSEILLTHINDIINNTNYIYVHLNDSKNVSNENTMKNKNNTMMNNIDTTILNILNDSIKDNNTIVNKTKHSSKHLFKNSSFIKNIRHQIVDNVKKIDKKYITGMEVLFPLIMVILIVVLVIYCIKKRKKNQINQEINNNIDKNGINFQNSANKTPYNRIQNTSGFNVGLNPNNLSMSEIKVQNLKDEIHNIITNNSGGSNSSGKRKREKRKMGNKNVNNSSQENNKGIQNEIKEEIKQYVIDEHLNNS